MKAFIDLEKQAVEDACELVEKDPSLETPDATNARRIRVAARQSAFLLNVTGSVQWSTAATHARTSVSAVLADVIGKQHGQLWRGASLRGQLNKRRHRQRQFAALFAEMEAWLSELGRAAGNNSDSRTSSHDVMTIPLASVASSPSGVAIKPFSLEHDSVLRQVRSYGLARTEAAPTGPTTGLRVPGRKKKLDPMK